MIITNGRILVQPEMNEESFAKIIEELEDNIKNFHDLEVKFVKVDKPYLQYEIPKELPWKNLKECLPADNELKIMGIGSKDEVTVPYFVNKVIDYRYSMEELNEVGDEMCDILLEVSKIDNEKKAIAKKLGERIAELQVKLNVKAVNHRKGFVTKEMKCSCILSYKEQNKRYYDSVTNELIHTEDMTSDDQRTLFDIKGFDLDTANELQGFSIEEAVEEELNQDLDDIQNENSGNANAIDMEEV